MLIGTVKDIEKLTVMKFRVVYKVYIAQVK